MVNCSKCERTAVIKYPTEPKYLCDRHFTKHFEKKVLHSIRKYSLLKKGERIGVACSGGKDSTTALYLIAKLAESRKDEKPIAIAINEGIHGYRDTTIKDLEKFCKEHEIELKVYSYKEELGETLDEFVKIAAEKKLGLKPCGICGVFRRYILNKKAVELKLDKLVTGHNLDDENQSFLINLFRGDLMRSARMGPKTGVREEAGFVPRVKPLYFCTDRENATYAALKGFPVTHIECPNAEGAYRQEMRKLLDSLEHKYPGTKNSLTNSGLEFIDVVKKHAESSDNPLQECLSCGEPSNGRECKACELLRKLDSEKRKLA